MKSDKLQKLYTFANIPKNHWDCSFSKIQDFPDKKHLQHWVDALEQNKDLNTSLIEAVGKKGLYIAGTYSRGKSGCAAVIAKLCIGYGYPVFWFTHADLVGFKHAEYKHHFSEGMSVWERINSVELLVINEFYIKPTKDNQSPWLAILTEEVIRNRLESGLLTIITTNQSSKDLMKESIIDDTQGLINVFPECMQTVIVKGRDLRKEPIK